MGEKFLKVFSLRKECANVILAKLEDTDSDDRHYIAEYFFAQIPEVLTNEGEIRRAVRAISAAIHNEDSNIREAVVSRVGYFPAAWQAQLAEALADITDPENPAVVLDDGTPLLKAPTVNEITNEDIPF